MNGLWQMVLWSPLFWGLVIVHLKKMNIMGFICLAILKSEISIMQYLSGFPVMCITFHFDWVIKVSSFSPTFVEKISGLEDVFLFSPNIVKGGKICLVLYFKMISQTVKKRNGLDQRNYFTQLIDSKETKRRGSE